MIIFVFIKVADIDPVLFTPLYKRRIQSIEDLEKERGERRSQTQGNSTDAAIS